MGTYTPKEFQKKIQRFARQQPKLLKRALLRSTEEVRGVAISKHLSGPKMPKGKGSLTNATLARHSGDLAGSLNTKVSVTATKQTAQISSNMKYSRVHEKGGKFMPKRPYLGSSLAEKRKNIVDNILKAMIEGYKRT